MDGIWLINDPSSGWRWIPHHRNCWSTSTIPARHAGVAETNAPAGHQVYPALTCVVVWSVLMMEPPRTSPFSFTTTVIMMNMTVNEFDTAMWSNGTTEWDNLDARLPWDTIICNVNSYPFWFVLFHVPMTKSGLISLCFNTIWMTLKDKTYMYIILEILDIIPLL